MVTIASPQTNEAEQRKRKQTVERTKANHLSKQLQMRLQYAKLKVEHGWQRQNLNEVENLYFHHSQVRGLRPVVPAKSLPLISMNPVPSTSPLPEPTAMVVDDTSHHAGNSEAPPPDNPQWPTSPQCAFKSPVASNIVPLQNNVTSKSGTPSLPESAPSQESSQHPAPVLLHTQSDTAPPQPPSLSVTSIPQRFLDFSDPANMQKSTQTQTQTHMQLQPQPQPQPQSQSKAHSQNQPSTSNQAHSQPQPQPYNPYMPAIRQSSQPQPNPFTPQPPPQYSFTQSYQASSVQNQSNPQVALSQPSSSSQSSFGNGSGPLTYDSFWSTHASAGSMYRTHAGFTASTTPTGHLAMITPGGHAAVMTAEGVYVGAAGYTGRVNV